MTTREDFQCFRESIELREVSVDGVGPWWWIKGDVGTWTGPVNDWCDSHKHLYLKHLKKREVVVTAGANQGLHARFYASAFQEVYAFEPNPLSFYVLNLNAPFPNVFKFNTALASTAGQVRIDGAINNSGQWTVNANEGIKVPTLAIDDLKLWACDFIQLDVEGYESRVIEGAIGTIERYRPVIAAENGAQGEFQRKMESLGYVQVEQSVSDAIWVSRDS